MSRWKTQDEFPGSISLPYGIKTSHTWHEIGQILRIVNDMDVATFIEIGTHVGGLASALIPRENYYAIFRYVGFELDMGIVDPLVQDWINQADVFTEEFRRRVADIIGDRPGACLVYCDNGDKVREMQIFSGLLRPNDVIMCHDFYHPNKKVYGLSGFGEDNGACGCKPEVWTKDIQFLLDDDSYELLPEYMVEGTRIVGFKRI